jgi:hypothetical protein
MAVASVSAIGNAVADGRANPGRAQQALINGVENDHSSMRRGPFASASGCGHPRPHHYSKELRKMEKKTEPRVLSDAELDHVTGGCVESNNPNVTCSGKLENAPKGTPPSRPHFK